MIPDMACRDSQTHAHAHHAHHLVVVPAAIGNDDLLHHELAPEALHEHGLSGFQAALGQGQRVRIDLRIVVLWGTVGQHFPLVGFNGNGDQLGGTGQYFLSHQAGVVFSGEAHTADGLADDGCDGFAQSVLFPLLRALQQEEGGSGGQEHEHQHHGAKAQGELVLVAKRDVMLGAGHGVLLLYGLTTRRVLFHCGTTLGQGFTKEAGIGPIQPGYAASASWVMGNTGTRAC